MTETSPVPEAAPAAANLLAALTRLALLQRETVDRLALQEAATAALLAAENDPHAALDVVTTHLQLRRARWLDAPDASSLPALVVDAQGQWGLLRGRNAKGQWQTEWQDAATKQWREATHDALPDHAFATVKLAAPYDARKSPVLHIVISELLAQRGLLFEAAAGGLLLAIFGVAISFYSMQVYDRVVPTGASQTLLVLSLGILAIVAMEYVTKRARSYLHEQLIEAVDQRLARTVYLRFLAVRLDQLPGSVGSLAAQLRGYESVRGFLVSATTHLLVDAPFAIIFVLVIAMIAPPLALIPLIALLIGVSAGFFHGNKIMALSVRGHAAANMKTGLLVESVEGAEIIKSGQGGWRMLNRWLATADDGRDIDLQMRDISDRAQSLAMALQQSSYVLMLAFGALMAFNGELTLGGLIACSILSGRALTPATQVVTQLIAWSQAKAALQGLDRIWALEDDHHGHDQPVFLESLRGQFRFDNAVMRISGKPALNVPQLRIEPGERIGVLGPIGAGKTTLLRLLSGMYKPQEGRVFLDDIDLAGISKPLLAEHIGYLPQDGRLLGGSLRENLILGLADPGDDAILAVARLTGLYESVVATHPKGLQQEIPEGGTGMSGGQRQLVNLTRVFLRKPRLWLLDEPTASLDRATEIRIVNALQTALRPEDTLVLVTHKPELLGLVNRLMVIANQQVLLDGPRDAVLARLQAGVSVAGAQTNTNATATQTGGGAA